MVKKNGRWKTKSVESLQLAQQIEAKWKNEIIIESLIPESAPIPMLEDIWERFDRLHNANLKSPSFWRKLWNTRVQKEFGNWRLDQIKPQDISEFICSMRSLSRTGKKGRPLATATIVGYAKLIGRLYSYGIKNGLYDGRNPLKQVELPRFDNQVTNPLTDDELDRLLGVLKSWQNRMVALGFMFCLATGKRTGEVFGLRWEDVDFENAVMRFEIKSMVKGRSQYLPMNEMARGILVEARQERRGRSSLVFHSCNGKQIHYRWPWTRIKEKAGLRKEIRPHDLRHTFASRLISTGKVDLYTLQNILGHKTVAMTKRYAHLADHTLKEALDLVDEAIR